LPRPAPPRSIAGRGGAAGRGVVHKVHQVLITL